MSHMRQDNDAEETYAGRNTFSRINRAIKQISTQDHQLRHLGKQLYSCERCGFSTSYVSSLREHVKTCKQELIDALERTERE